MEGEGNLGHWLPGLEGAFSIQIVICGILSAAYHCTTRKNYEDKLVKRTSQEGYFPYEVLYLLLCSGTPFLSPLKKF